MLNSFNFKFDCCKIGHGYLILHKNALSVKKSTDLKYSSNRIMLKSCIQDSAHVKVHKWVVAMLVLELACWLWCFSYC